DQVGREILEVVNVDDGLEHGPVGPEVRAAHVAKAHDLDRLVHARTSSGHERTPQPSARFGSVRSQGRSPSARARPGWVASASGFGWGNLAIRAKLTAAAGMLHEASFQLFP